MSQIPACQEFFCATLLGNDIVCWHSGASAQLKGRGVASKKALVFVQMRPAIFSRSPRVHDLFAECGGNDINLTAKLTINRKPSLNKSKVQLFFVMSKNARILAMISAVCSVLPCQRSFLNVM